MKLTQRLKVMLRALLVKAGELHAEKNGEAVTLIFDGETAEVGVEVFVEQQNGDEVEVNPAPDGEYNVDDKVYVVRDGKIAEIKDKEQPEEPKEVRLPRLQPTLTLTLPLTLTSPSMVRKSLRLNPQTTKTSRNPKPRRTGLPVWKPASVRLRRLSRPSSMPSVHLSPALPRWRRRSPNSTVSLRVTRLMTARI